MPYILYSPYAGFIIQLLPSNDVLNVKLLLERADDTGIECYIRESCNGMGVLHWAASNQSAEMMHCLVSRIEDFHHISDDFQQIVRPAYRVLGFPLIRHYSFKTPLQIAVQNEQEATYRRHGGPTHNTMQHMTQKNAYQFTGDQSRWNKGRRHCATSTQRQQPRKQRQHPREQRDQQRWNCGRYGSSSSSWKQEPVGSWRQQPSGERN